MVTQDKALAFTGHRPESFPFGEDEQSLECITLKEMLSFEITQKVLQGYSTFYSGVARGADIFFAEEVLRIRKTQNTSICLICVVPFP